jgi:predicted exporter
MPQLFPSTTGSASDALASLTRAQWADWVSNWQPFENKLFDYAQDPTVVAKAMTGASQDVNAAFDQQAVSTQERLRGLGMSLNADEQHAVNRSTGLARSLADVNAQNLARDSARARQQSILGNPAPNITSGG